MLYLLLMMIYLLISNFVTIDQYMHIISQSVFLRSLIDTEVSVAAVSLVSVADDLLSAKCL